MRLRLAGTNLETFIFTRPDLPGTLDLLAIFPKKTRLNTHFLPHRQFVTYRPVRHLIN